MKKTYKSSLGIELPNDYDEWKEVDCRKVFRAALKWRERFMLVSILLIITLISLIK